MTGPPSQPTVPRIVVQMTDKDIVARIADLFGVSYQPTKPRETHHKVSYTVSLRGKRAVEIMKELRPLMGKRRQAAIDKAIDSHVVVTPKLNEFSPVMVAFKGMVPAKDLSKFFGVSESAVFKTWQGRLGLDPELIKAINLAMEPHRKWMKEIADSFPQHKIDLPELWGIKTP